MRKDSRLPRLADLPKLNAQQLQAVHHELFGSEHPVANCQHLRRKIAWHMQAAEEGSGLAESVRQYAIAIARGTELRSRISANAARRRTGAASEQAVTSTIPQTHDARLPMPGSLIVKKYKSNTIVVQVLDGGFEYDGRRFTSLSAIASEITGARWNGFAFFGLEKEVHHAR
jgi:hypothetical protein